MKAMSKLVLLLAIALALTSSGGGVYAKNGGGQNHPTEVKTSGVSGATSGTGGNQSKPTCFHRDCRPGHTQPTCLGPHRGPNGVMIQCD